ncbi:META domain-containing protein [Gulosibacter chungangensis]|uniref:META domain-containing protein n=1 Tax=Gulosibacter chungangensis TaxID=979746 RepID=A0A7J5B981_9MICO|nr:META domain-containing protein [Gulosibacter chungangensis]KAB1642164.1 META domain-containing protein [Gulosibacter chungangensis]
MPRLPFVGRYVFSALAATAGFLFLTSCSAEEAAPVPSPHGFWGSEASDQPNLSFSGDTVHGTDGCNRLNGTWRHDVNDRIRFEEITSTRMHCDWVNTWLEELDTAVIHGDEMHVFNSSGVEIGTLTKN